MQITESNSGLASKTGSQVLEAQGTAVVGMSLGNKYFSESNIAELLGLCRGSFSDVRVMITDVIGVDTLLAEGYPRDEAIRKARLDGNALRNRIKRVIKASDGPEVKILDWMSGIEAHPIYQESLAEVKELYDTVDSFRNDVRAATASVLEGKLRNGQELEFAIDTGVHYLLAELAFLGRSPEILGTEQIAYVYHRGWPIFTNFINGEYDGEQRVNVGFVVVR